MVPSQLRAGTVPRFSLLPVTFIHGTPETRGQEKQFFFVPHTGNVARRIFRKVEQYRQGCVFRAAERKKTLRDTGMRNILNSGSVKINDMLITFLLFRPAQCVAIKSFINEIKLKRSG